MYLEFSCPRKILVNPKLLLILEEIIFFFFLSVHSKTPFSVQLSHGDTKLVWKQKFSQWLNLERIFNMADHAAEWGLCVWGQRSEPSPAVLKGGEPGVRLWPKLENELLFPLVCCPCEGWGHQRHVYILLSGLIPGSASTRRSPRGEPGWGSPELTSSVNCRQGLINDISIRHFVQLSVLFGGKYIDFFIWLKDLKSILFRIKDCVCRWQKIYKWKRKQNKKWISSL